MNLGDLKARIKAEAYRPPDFVQGTVVARNPNGTFDVETKSGLMRNVPRSPDQADSLFSLGESDLVETVRRASRALMQFGFAAAEALKGQPLEVEMWDSHGRPYVDGQAPPVEAHQWASVPFSTYVWSAVLFLECLACWVVG